jgi:hypothetical protein
LQVAEAAAAGLLVLAFHLKEILVAVAQAVMLTLLLKQQLVQQQ